MRWKVIFGNELGIMDGNVRILRFTFCLPLLFVLVGGCDENIFDGHITDGSGGVGETGGTDGGVGDGVDESGGMVNDPCSLQPFNGALNCDWGPWLSTDPYAQATSIIPPETMVTVQYVAGDWIRSVETNDWATLTGHFSFRSGTSVTTQDGTSFWLWTVVQAPCGEDWWVEVRDFESDIELAPISYASYGVPGKEILVVELPVLDPTIPTTAVYIDWMVEFCDPYVLISDISGGLMTPATFSSPGGPIVNGGNWEVLLSGGWVTGD